MTFNSFEFAVFLPVVWLLHSLLRRHRIPWLLWLLMASAFFYGCWKPWYLVLIGLSIASSWLFGGALHRAQREGARKALLIAALLVDLGLLGVFKYGNFLLESAEALGAAVGRPFALGRVPGELPVGISFYTFQGLSYTIDIYRRQLAPAQSPLHLAVFILFFPQLVAGPILRASEFLPQLEAPPRSEDPRAIGEGLMLILAGLIKKMVLADSIAVHVVEPFFRDPSRYGATEALYALWSANTQVYCDFSGYSDVAIGLGLLFGMRFAPNFNRPFLATTPMEHWRRWHISLSTWLRDYLYVPLGGSQAGPGRAALATVLTFLLGGIWHGAGWRFAVWGLYNGLLLVLWRRYVPQSWGQGWWGGLLTMNGICLGLTFLHSDDLTEAVRVFGRLGRPLELGGLWGGEGLFYMGLAWALHLSPPRWKAWLLQSAAETPAWGLGALVVLVGGLLVLYAGRAQPFFYFQF